MQDIGIAPPPGAVGSVAAAPPPVRENCGPYPERTVAYPGRQPVSGRYKPVLAKTFVLECANVFATMKSHRPDIQRGIPAGM